jgi:hypothetical protein
MVLATEKQSDKIFGITGQQPGDILDEVRRNLRMVRNSLFNAKRDLIGAEATRLGQSPTAAMADWDAARSRYDHQTALLMLLVDVTP